MSIIAEIVNPWRQILLSAPASFRGVIFHVESGGLTSGRRTVIHEYPKRNKPYAEDMGRHAIRWQFSGYLIYRPSNPLYDYVSQRDQLILALAADDVGMLVHPVFAPGGVSAMCERYTSTETRERGGFTQFEMAFVEAGEPGNKNPGTDTASNVATQATNTETANANTFTNGISPISFIAGGLIKTFNESFGNWPTKTS
jgi:prophage DNA circulation protein